MLSVSTRGRYHDILQKNDLVVGELNLASPEFFDFLCAAHDLETAGLVDFLNQVGEQGIEKVDIRARVYIRNGEVLPLDYLCSAEKYLLICWIAVCIKQRVLLQCNLRALNTKCKRLLFSFLQKTAGYDYVVFVMPTESEGTCLKRLEGILC